MTTQRPQIERPLLEAWQHLTRLNIKSAKGHNVAVNVCG